MLPSKVYRDADRYPSGYSTEIVRAAQAGDDRAIKAAALFSEAVAADWTIFACGKGSSAADSES
jgi:phosphoheptose isomerase